MLVGPGLSPQPRFSGLHVKSCDLRERSFSWMLKKPHWPLMDADEREFKDAKTLVFNLRLSAFISGQLCL
jgi:hypothetical protein